ncbi:MAG: DUF11 domain-containing protein [Sphingomonas sp.]|nr:DUF11 domain-containing protein [Sphingomonas sp.]
MAAKTPAGTLITNIAKATYDLPNGGSGSVDSNSVSVKVDEILDVSVATLSASDVIVSPGATKQVLVFKVTNAGNGPEAFKLTARDNITGDDFDPTTTSIVLDTNGNGSYDPGVDTVYVAGANDPLLAADASVTVFLLSTIPAAATDGQRGEVDLVAAAMTGTGTAGTVFTGQGQGGGDAVVGSTGASAQDKGFYRVSAALVGLAKSAAVSDPFGGTTHVPGSTITYTLVASVTGSGSIANLTLTDSAPVGTTYQPGTLDLGGTSLTDAADGDQGEVVGGNVVVRLGNVAAGASRTVTFKVKVN